MRSSTASSHEPGGEDGDPESSGGVVERIRKRTRLSEAYSRPNRTGGRRMPQSNMEKIEQDSADRINWQSSGRDG